RRVLFRSPPSAKGSGGSMDWSLFMDTQLDTGEFDLFCRMRLCFTETHGNTHTHTHTTTHTHTHNTTLHTHTPPHTHTHTTTQKTHTYFSDSITLWSRSCLDRLVFIYSSPMVVGVVKHLIFKTPYMAVFVDKICLFYFL